MMRPPCTDRRISLPAINAGKGHDRAGPLRRRCAQGIVVCALVVVTACSMAPDYQIPEVPVAGHYREAGWAPAAPADHLSRGHWWTLYGDAELDALAARFEANSPDLAAALARFDQAAAYRDQTRSILFPRVSVEGQVTNNREAAMDPPGGSIQHDYNSNMLGAGASYEVDLWGRVRNAVRAGDAQFAAAAADLESARLSLQAELVDDYVQLRRLDREAKLLADTAEAYERALDVTLKRHQAGVTSGLDVARARTQLRSTKALISTTAADRALFEHAIAVLIGESPSSFTISAREQPLTLPVIPTDIPAMLLQRRPDIAAAERRTAAASATVGVARAAWFPSISLSGNVGYASFERTDWFRASNLFWSIGPGLALDLFDGGLRDAQLRQARAALDQAGADYRAVALGAFAQVEDNLALLDRYRIAAEEQGLAVDSARQAQDYAMVRYRAGAANYLEVTTAQAAALRTQRDALALETGQLRASVALVRALGGGWQARDIAVSSVSPVAAREQ